MRSDGDSWDITTSVGSTALFVAAARALEAQKSEPLAVDPFAEVFLRAVGGSWSALLDGGDPDHILKSADFGEAFVDFQGARTRYFDRYVANAAAAGVRQTVILAAGLDSRAYRLDWPAGTVVYELDQPQVLEFKRTVLAQHGHQPTAERREIAIDLRNDWVKALRDKGFDADAPSAWVVEGLLMYLPAEVQADLFTGIDGLASSGSHVAVEQAAPMPDDVFEAAKAGQLGAEAADGYFSLVYNQQFAPAEEWFAEHGWRVEAAGLPGLLSELGRTPADGSPGAFMLGFETLVSAQKD